MNNILQQYRLEFNPFPVAATGILPPAENGASGIYCPKSWSSRLESLFQDLASSGGPKMFPIVGEYGTGKTTLLQGIVGPFFESKGYKIIYFENPGLQLYDLANTLMRKLGRYEFAKALWEACKKERAGSDSGVLFKESFHDWLARIDRRVDRDREALSLQNALIRLGVTADEEIGAKLAKTIVETGVKPFFEYRDFVAGTKDALVAENMEAQYFTVLVKCIQLVYQVKGVVFLLDEFEDVAIDKQMTRSKGFQYLATLRRLLDLSNSQELWMILAMTPESLEQTSQMNPAWRQRFVPQAAFSLVPLDLEEAKGLTVAWLDRGRGKLYKEYMGKLFPFADDFLACIANKPDLLMPRALVNVLRKSIEDAVKDNIKPPLGSAFLETVTQVYSDNAS